MSRKIDYKRGQILGDQCTFIRDVNPHIKPSGEKVRKALFQCRCGNFFETAITNVKERKTTSCGCVNISKKITHGMRSHKLYDTWCAVKSRCFNQNAANYKYYGGRGITVSDEFKDDPKAFIDYLESLENCYKKGYTLDRINNDGNYERGNLRWASKVQQSTNRRMNKNNTTGFKGVSYKKDGSNFKAGFYMDKKQIEKRGFPTAESAYAWRVQQIKKHNLIHYSEFNF